MLRAYSTKQSFSLFLLWLSQQRSCSAYRTISPFNRFSFVCSFECLSSVAAVRTALSVLLFIFSFDLCKQSTLNIFYIFNKYLLANFWKRQPLTIYWPIFEKGSRRQIIGQFLKKAAADSLLANFSKSCPPTVIFLFPRLIKAFPYCCQYKRKFEIFSVCCKQSFSRFLHWLSQQCSCTAYHTISPFIHILLWSLQKVNFEYIFNK